MIRVFLCHWMNAASCRFRPHASRPGYCHCWNSSTMTVHGFRVTTRQCWQAWMAQPAHWVGGDKLRELGQRLRDFSGIKECPPAEGFNATLRPYQQAGLNWLQFLREYGLAGILADDMGLKTVQTLAHLHLEKASGRANLPSLVIGPTSLLTNWRNEAAEFTPNPHHLDSAWQGPFRPLPRNGNGRPDLDNLSFAGSRSRCLDGAKISSVGHGRSPVHQESQGAITSGCPATESPASPVTDWNSAGKPSRRIVGAV